MSALIQPSVIPMLNVTTLMEVLCACVRPDIWEMDLPVLVWTEKLKSVLSGYHYKLFFSDVNECNISADNCDPENGACANTEGSFICTCNIGYTGDGINCTSECDTC